MDRDAAADELYGANPDEFVQRRTGLVAAARQAGDRALAKEIGQLRKPTRTAWLVNLVARADPAGLDALLALGPALQDAQARRAGDELRSLSRERRRRIDALTKRAIALAAETGYAAPDAAVQEVSATLQAALGDPATAEVVRAGRLVQATTYGGFGPAGSGGGGEVIDLMAVLQASMATTGAGPPVEAVPPQDADEGRAARVEETAAERAAAQARRTAAEEALSSATQTWESRRDAAEDAAAEADRSTTDADALADRIESLRQELREAEAAERRARESARAARKKAMQLRQEAAAAERAVTTARADLAALD